MIIIIALPVFALVGTPGRYPPGTLLYKLYTVDPVGNEVDVGIELP
jgi:hypothetical protein